MPTANTPRRLQPRKRPVQARAQQTRDRVLEAAARVFARHGYAAGTTNRIAAEAGMSIGSLYQYFPNKDAILVELVRRHLAEGTAAVVERVARVGGLPDRLDDRIGLFVDAMLANHVGDPRLHQVLFEEAPRPRTLLDELHATEEWAVALAEQVLRSDPTVRVADVAMAARLVVTAIESLVHRYVSSRPDDLDVETFRRELVAMLTRYLTGGSAVPSGG
jgi:AcrR family transcriptional regulator